MSATDPQKQGELSPTVAIEPYRVEWRANLTTGWQLMNRCELLGDAQAHMQMWVERFNGQARVVGQRVVLAHGLCSHITND